MTELIRLRKHTGINTRCHSGAPFFGTSTTGGNFGNEGGD
jgi:hypothetical protein